MSQLPPPPPPPAAEPAPQSGNAGWKVATALSAALGLILTGTVYVLMDQRIADLEEDLAAAHRNLAEAERPSESSLSGLEDLLGGLEGLGDLGDLLGLGDLLDDDLDGIDPILFECLAPAEFNLDFGGSGSIPDSDIGTQVNAIRDIIADERGLAADGDLDIEFVSLDEVQRRAVQLTEQELDHDAAVIGSRLLAALGAVAPGTDLAQAQLDALDAGVGGFYDPDTGQLVIGSEKIDGMGAYITSHELVHALADARFGLPDTVALADTRGADAAYAALNAIEGDATLYGQMFITAHLPMTELLALEAQSAETDAEFAALPHYVRRGLEFPYVEGMTFACDMYLDGGWAAVDATYVTPPDTTAQILFPDRYRTGEGAIDVRTPTGPEGWQELDSDTFGAADLLFLLEAPGGDASRALDEPKHLVQSWAGGQVTIWDRDGETAVALLLAERGTGQSLCETLTDYYTAAFPNSTRGETADGVIFEEPSQAAHLSCANGEVALGIGPTTDIARSAIS